jgi:SNF2 family DNA or RNA helicase
MIRRLKSEVLKDLPDKRRIAIRIEVPVDAKLKKQLGKKDVLEMLANRFNQIIARRNDQAKDVNANANEGRGSNAGSNTSSNRSGRLYHDNWDIEDDSIDEYSDGYGDSVSNTRNKSHQLQRQRQGLRQRQEPRQQHKKQRRVDGSKKNRNLSYDQEYQDEDRIHHDEHHDDDNGNDMHIHDDDDDEVDGDSNSCSNGSNKRDHVSVLELFQKTSQVKLNGVIEHILDLLQSDVKFLVFGHHHTVLDALEEALIKNESKYIRIDGRTAGDERQKLAGVFQSDSSVQAAILGIQAAGEQYIVTFV